MESEIVPKDNNGIAILDLEAQVKAQQLILGALLVHSPDAFRAIERIEPIAADYAIQFVMSDRQVAVFQAELSQIVQVVRQYRAAMGLG